LVKVEVNILNTRAFKNEADGVITITVGSIIEKEESHEFEGRNFKVKYGEFKPFLERLVAQLEQALPFCANDTQKKMHELYIESYKTGSINTHKDSQRAWIADKGPIVESN
jgi:dipeptidyl-peptidase-3